MSTDVRALYEQDFYAWTLSQAEALRRLAAEHWNGPLDLEHLAEEVEDLGRENYNAVVSHMEVLIAHLLKLEYSPSLHPRRRWQLSISNARRAIHRRLSATLINKFTDEWEEIYHAAREAAAVGLIDFGEVEAARALPRTCPYTLDQLLDRAWLPDNRHELVDEEL